MSFAAPHILWLLLVLPPLLVVFFWWSWKQRQVLMTQFIQARLLPGLISGLSTARQKLRLAALVLAVVFVIVSLARPQWGFDVQEVKQRGVDIVVAVDTSKSMLAEDIAPNRLTRAKLAALDLMQVAKSDRLGLVAFAGTAFLQCPLTIDDVAFRQSVEALNVNLIPQGGTALAEAIQTALTAFKEEDNHKVLVLLTDGEDHDSGALEAAKKAAQAGLRIFTVGIGTREGELLRIKDEKGQSDYVRDEQGNVVKSHLDEDLLHQIAEVTGGGYLPLRGAKTIDSLYEQGLANLPKSEHQEKRVHQPKERFRWPLSAAILLLLIEMLLPERKTERNTSRELSLASRAGAGVAVGLFLLLNSPSLIYGSPSSALREYKAGKYEDALKDYEQALRRKGDDPRLHFNAGTSAYRNRQFEEAAKEFEKALASPDLKLQQASYYNRGNTWYWLGEKNADIQKRTEAWKKAVEDYGVSLKLNPQDADAKFNHEFVQRKLEELQQQQQKQPKNDQRKIEPSEAAKKAKAEADEAVRRREYAQALEIMEKQLKQDETTAYYGDYIERLKEINGVQQQTKP
jgi:Ca-activated chloride channel family protein